MTSITLELAHTWIVFTEGSSTNHRSEVDLILYNENGLVIELSMHFEFSTTNNHVEYEAFITVEMGAKEIKFQENSQLVVSHVKRDTQTKY